MKIFLKLRLGNAGELRNIGTTPKTIFPAKNWVSRSCSALIAASKSVHREARLMSSALIVFTRKFLLRRRNKPYRQMVDLVFAEMTLCAETS